MNWEYSTKFFPLREKSDQEEVSRPETPNSAVNHVSDPSDYEQILQGDNEFQMADCDVDNLDDWDEQRKYPMECNETHRENYGCKLCFRFFELFISEDITNKIVNFTNQRAHHSIVDLNSALSAGSKDWTNIDVIGMKAFMGVLLLSGRFHEFSSNKQILGGE
ncbi:hypothetical protein J437_LFUL008585 [Ladona fulva]|uniref:PiggyBac transposable element-derived protein domain-containing protein n=1 Tax=Ladona fulva TaxID=123851 RepID=A0A8K0P229_LADFU|nr:hypothetical protein J437_LFUL008585 [Ladona fulva]